MNKHRWYDVIVAWTEGKEIQFSYDGNQWEDLGEHHNLNAFNASFLEWRIKPKPKTVTRRFRMAVLDNDFTGELVCALDTANSCVDDCVEYSLPGFVRWVGEPVEVELEVNDENE